MSNKATKKPGKELRFLNHLLSGKTISRAQARVNHRLGNPSATVLRFEDAGYEVKRVYTTTRRKVDGKSISIRTVKYSIGLHV